MDHVYGYVIINDLTERGLQAGHKQWFLGKFFETSCPMGPWIVTADFFRVLHPLPSMRSSILADLRSRFFEPGAIHHHIVRSPLPVCGRSLR